MQQAPPDFPPQQWRDGKSGLAFAQRYAPAKARKDLADMEVMAPTFVPTFDLVKAAMELSMTYWISGYDSIYVALSKRLGVP